MTVTTKSRVTGLASMPCYVIRNGTVISSESKPYATGSQQIISEGHAYSQLGKSGRDIGGPFSNFKLEVGIGGPSVRRRIRNGVVLEEVQSLPLPPGIMPGLLTSLATAAQNGDSSSVLAPAVANQASDSNLNALGATLVSLCSPTNPTVDLATSLAEFLSERKFFALPGKAGSVEGEYLNYMFGVAPTISDVQDLRKAIRDKEKILEQFRRDRGRRIRRSASLPPESHTDVSYVYDRNPSSFGPLGSSYLFGRGTVTKVVTTQVRTYFKGAFVYTYPDDGFGKTIAELDRLYGVKPDIGTAWELVPFSWLLDYKLSTGAAIKNMAAFRDGLVMSYGYLMRETKVRTTETWTGPLGDNVDGVLSVGSASSWYEYTTQQRVAANPFGFGIKPGDLSARQLSILAALGISLGRN